VCTRYLRKEKKGCETPRDIMGKLTEQRREIAYSCEGTGGNAKGQANVLTLSGKAGRSRSAVPGEVVRYVRVGLSRCCDGAWSLSQGRDINCG
jgi:hypothetical protein